MGTNPRLTAKPTYVYGHGANFTSFVFVPATLEEFVDALNRANPEYVFVTVVPETVGVAASAALLGVDSARLGYDASSVTGSGIQPIGFPERPNRIAFVFRAKEAMFAWHSFGYRTIEDLVSGTEQGFPYGSFYHDAKVHGFAEFSVYLAARTRGYISAEDYKNGTDRETGAAIERFHVHQSTIQRILAEKGRDLLPLSRSRWLPSRASSSVPESDLYYASLAMGCNSYDEMLATLDKGFTSASDRRAAEEQGFADANSWKRFLKEGAGFDTAAEYRTALDTGFLRPEPYHSYLKLLSEMKGREFRTVEEIVVTRVLERLLAEGRPLLLSEVHQHVSSDYSELRGHVAESNRSQLFPPLSFKSAAELGSVIRNRRVALGTVQVDSVRGIVSVKTSVLQ